MGHNGKYFSFASEWALENGYSGAEFVTTEQGGEVYHLPDTALLGLKTGLPKFVVINNGQVVDSSINWGIHTINRYTSLLRGLQSSGNST